MAISRMVDQIGRVLSGRYRLIAPIGVGASAQVFLADDTRLRRRVAVKLLHAALADDESFLRRFRAEAQAAAALNHPNIMSVYDWGDDDEAPYLVTEYLGGGSLRAILDQGRRLTVSQALLVGLEAARALDYAHRRGFVHRDIKPANLLFGEEGRLRIADFGLARALAEAAWTEPAGAVLGTARYAAPEQARGEAVDGKADVYALGLVLIEAVTGEVPFASDTTIATLMARVDRPVEAPEALGPLAKIIERAGVPDAADRPDSGEFGVGLMAAANDLPRPDPLPLAGAVVPAGEAPAVDRDPTLLPVAPAADDAATIGAIDGEESGDGSGQKPSRRSRRVAKRETRRAERAAGLRPRRRWPWVALIVALVAALVTGGVLAANTLLVPSHEMPALVDLQEAQARSLIEQNGWKVRRTEARRDNTVVGQVLSQHPAKGVKLKEGETVKIQVSLGFELTNVPQDLPGKSLDEAKAALEAALLVMAPDPARRFDESVPKDHVIALADGTEPTVARQTPIGLIVSDGPEPRTVPTIPPGSTFEQAQALLVGVQLRAQKVDEFSDTIPEGQFIRSEPAAGQKKDRDGTVKVVISKGVETIPVPDVRGMSVAAASAAIEGAGLTIDGVSGNPTRNVIATDPAPNTRLRRGESVLLFTGK